MSFHIQFKTDHKLNRSNFPFPDVCPYVYDGYLPFSSINDIKIFDDIDVKDVYIGRESYTNTRDVGLGAEYCKIDIIESNLEN